MHRFGSGELAGFINTRGLYLICATTQLLWPPYATFRGEGWPLIGYQVLCGACFQGFADQCQNIVPGGNAFSNHMMSVIDSTSMDEVTAHVYKSLMSTSHFRRCKNIPFTIPVRRFTRRDTDVDEFLSRPKFP